MWDIVGGVGIRGAPVGEGASPRFPQDLQQNQSEMNEKPFQIQKFIKNKQKNQ